jgi:hypothetical protein
MHRKVRQYYIIFAAFAALLCMPAFAADPYAMQGVVLLQPEAVLSERVTALELAAYIKAVNAEASASLSGIADAAPAAGFIVVAVRPGGQSRVWLDFSPALPAAVAARLAGSVEQLKPFDAQHGVVVFALNTTLWGAAPTTSATPAPAEWTEATKLAGVPMEVGALVEHLWPR